MEKMDTFALIGQLLDAADLKYNADEDKRLFWFSMKGDPISAHFLIRADEEGQSMEFICSTNFYMPEVRRVEGALAVCAISHTLPAGDLEYDITDGSVVLRRFVPIKNRTFDEKFLRATIAHMHAVMESVHTRMTAVGEGLLTVSELLNKMNGE